MSKHTPGPWTCQHLHVWKRNYEKYTCTTGEVVDIDLAIADADDGDDGPANARLIAAAPELLACLRAVVYPDNGRTIDFDSMREYYHAFIEGGELERARAAIAKAEGCSTERAYCPQCKTYVDAKPFTACACGTTLLPEEGE